MKRIPVLLLMLLMLTIGEAGFVEEPANGIASALTAAGLQNPVLVQTWGNVAACFAEQNGIKHLLVLDNREGSWHVTVDNDTALIQDADWPELWLDSDNAVYWTYRLSEQEVLRYHSARNADGNWGPVDQYYSDSGFGEYTRSWSTWWDEAHGGEIIRSYSVSDMDDNMVGSEITQYFPATWMGDRIALSDFDLAHFPTFIDPQFGAWFETDQFFRDAANVLMPESSYIKGLLKDGAMHFLMQKPDGARVYVVCEYESRRAVNLIESSPLPGDTVLGHENFTDSLWMDHRCVSVHLINQCTAGIEYIYDDSASSGESGGFLFFGDRTVWDGSEVSAQTILYGDHPWDDIAQIDWNRLPHSLDEASAQMDSGRCAMVVNPDAADRLNLREKNDRSSRSMGRYYTGTPVLVLQTDGDWAQVMIGQSTDGGQEGWMMSRYLTFGQADRPLQLNTSAMPRLFSREDMLKVYAEPRAGACTIHRGDTWKIVGIVGNEWYHVWFPATGEYGFVRQGDLTEGNG